MKFGIIQSAAQTADLSTNLRNIVQSYRDCIDKGAQLVIAHAFALVGPNTYDLKERRSFQKQCYEALNLLAKELSTVPLILAAFAEPYIDQDDEELFDSATTTELELPQVLTPFLLEDGLVNQLEDGEVSDILGLNIVCVVGDDYHMVEEDNFDLIVRLSTKAWYYSGIAAEEDERNWEAKMNHCPSLTVIPSGYAEGYYYPGGSSLSGADGTTRFRLPLFEASQGVVSLDQQTLASPLPVEEEMLRCAIIKSLREHLKNMGYSGICLNLDLANSKLLALLCAEAIGASKVHGISFSDAALKEEQKLGIKVQNLSSLCGAGLTEAQNILKQEALLPYQARMQAAITNCYAEQEDLMMLSPLDKRQILLGDYTPYAESCAKLLPFGSLYQVDLHQLKEYLSGESIDYFGVLCEPAQPEIDRILTATQNFNIGSTQLLETEEEDLDENDVRYVQRRVKAAAEMAAQLPPRLHLENPKEDKHYPTFHKLND